MNVSVTPDLLTSELLVQTPSLNVSVGCRVFYGCHSERAWERTLTRSSEVSQRDLGRFDLSGHIFGHALVHSLIRLPGVLDHQRPVLQQVQTAVVAHV